MNACIRWLFLHNCFVWRNNTGSYKASYTKKDGSQQDYRIGYGFKGSPDIIGITASGRFIGVECKFGSNKLSVEQCAFRDRVMEKQGIFITAYSTDDLEARKAEIIGRLYCIIVLAR